MYHLFNAKNIFQIKYLSDINIIFTEKYRQPNIVNSQQVESIIEVMLKGKSLKLTITNYIDGVFASHQAWTTFKR